MSIKINIIHKCSVCNDIGQRKAANHDIEEAEGAGGAM